MIVRYTENCKCYVLTNFAASNNPVFLSEEEVENFKLRLEKHLDGLCTILAYSFKNDHYQLVVALQDREAFIAYYKNKMKNSKADFTAVPESTYILSQAMANVQSGYAKWFNFRHGRFGTVFGRRYTKVLIENEVDLQNWVARVNANESLWTFSEFWSFIQNFVKKSSWLKKIDLSSDQWYVVEDQKSIKMNCFMTLGQYFLRGRSINFHPDT